MHRFKNILLVCSPLPRSSTSVNRAVLLARQNRARLTVVDVLEELAEALPMLMPVMTPQDLCERLICDRREELKRFVLPSLRGEVHVTIDVMVGTPFIEIVRRVLRDEHDLVITTAEGGRGSKKRQFGSRSLHLMRKCPCPVWVVRPERRTRYARILAAVDPDSCDEVKQQLNRRIIEMAASLARSDRAQLHILHTWSVWNERRLRELARSPAQYRQAVLEVRDARKQELSKLIVTSSLQGIDFRVTLLKGRAATKIVETVVKESIDLIVIGTVSRVGLAGLLISSTAENVMLRANCSVLGVKPYGFQSPVRPDDGKPPDGRSGDTLVASY